MLAAIATIAGIVVHAKYSLPEPENPRFVLLLPKGYTRDRSIPVVVWMHGYRSHPGEVATDELRAMADGLDVAVLGISATLGPGPVEYEWSEEIERDSARVAEALREVSPQLRYEPGQVVLAGFSQGAAMAIEVAASDARRYAGAIAFSPGTLSDRFLQSPSRSLSRQRYVVSVNANEHRGTVSLATAYGTELSRLGANVRHRIVPDEAEHVVPMDFADRFPEDIDFVLEARGRPASPDRLRALWVARLRSEMDQVIDHLAREGFLSESEIVEWALELVDDPSSDGFEEFARARAGAALAAHRAREASWAEPTDCDRLDRAFAALEAHGVMVRQNYRIQEVDAELRGANEAGQSFRGYAFYDAYDTEVVVNSGVLCLTYESVEGDEESSLAIGREVVLALERAGFRVDWNGQFDFRIAVRGLEWRRRRFSDAPN